MVLLNDLTRAEYMKRMKAYREWMKTTKNQRSVRSSNPRDVGFLFAKFIGKAYLHYYIYARSYLYKKQTTAEVRAPTVVCHELSSLCEDEH